ncbi:MAG: SUMF1/EgtB/PvdO family nonheme iron enzyme [Planctomycetes bacterium]|nr:SUMF1/EgtB/PvdO family nonheme iron enzyme [Planctomycetota bacterium]
MSDDDPQPGEEAGSARFGNYRLIRQIGRGGQGTVHLAEDLKLHREVALKILPPDYASSADARLRLEREAETTARINHACVAKIYEIGNLDGQVYMAMEYIEGRTLAAYVEAARADGSDSCQLDDESTIGGAGARPGETAGRGSSTGSQRAAGPRRPINRLLEVFEEVADGLEAAHAKGLVHRDLKPANIMLRCDGQPVILDFGLAQDLDSEGVTLTRTGQLLGTPAYMAPEQVRGDRGAVDHRSDIYSLGVTLFECCTLGRPFAGSTRHDLLRAITDDAARRPRSINPGLSADLEAIILTAIDPDPRRRYQSAAEMADDLRRCRRHEPIRARRIGPTLRMARWVRRNALLSGLAAVIFLALLTVSLVLYVKNRDVTRALAEARRSNQAKDEALHREQRALADRTAALEAERRERQAKERALRENLRLADLQLLEVAEVAAGALYPPDLELIERLARWLRRYEPVVARRSVHEADLADLRARALPYSEADRRRDYAREYEELGEVDRALAATEADRIARGDQSLPTDVQARVDKHQIRKAELEATIARRLSWHLTDENDQFQHDTLTRLIEELDAFTLPEAGFYDTVRRRTEDCRTIARITLDEAAEAWRAARERLAAQPLYAGLQLEPQIGLIPLGPDPDSGLEEFLHWLSHEGPVPRRDPATGRIALDEKLGLILVLVPGGRFLMGSQKDDPRQPNYDPDSRSDERPPNLVELRPYLLGKHEMTQGQWLRAFGANPSSIHPGFQNKKVATRSSLLCPVETVSWQDCRTMLPRIGLDLPTEAEWERAARAGRDDQVWPGTSLLEELGRFANICGEETVDILSSTHLQKDFRDDFVVHTEVGRLAPNPWGFHDLGGNVWEFCLDGAEDSYKRPARGRGLRSDPERSRARRVRGGGFNGDATLARIAVRNLQPPVSKGNAVGVRPVMVLFP